MATDLAQKKCIPCEGGVDPISVEQAQEYLRQLDPGWEIVSQGRMIERDFRFKDFLEALKFANAIGAVAKQEGHHPDLELGWGYVRVKLWTHSIGGLFDNDFILAAKIDELSFP